MYSSNLELTKQLPRIPGMTRLAAALSVWKTLLPQCNNPECTTRNLKLALSRRHSGVFLADEPYCTPECFEEAARKKMESLMVSRHNQEPAPRLRMPLGLALVSRGILTAEQLKFALEEQSRNGQSIGDIVQNLGFATPEQVTAAVAAQWSCPVFPLGDRTIFPQIAVPRRLLEAYGMLPVHFAENSRRLIVGFVSRVQYHILHTIENIADCVVTPCFITARDYQVYLQLPVFSERENEIVFDRVSGPAEMARLACNYVKQIKATRTRFGVCRDYLWMRMWGARHQMDLLFRLQQETSFQH